jgi:hypothetical protein
VRCNASKSNFNKFGKREIKNTIDFKLDYNIGFILDDNIDFID